jgi:predicted HicB family RNase H-like nuclease
VILMKSKSAPEYDVRFNIAATRPLVAAVANAASTNLCSINSYVRGALLAKLRADGFEPGKAA